MHPLRYLAARPPLRRGAVAGTIALAAAGLSALTVVLILLWANPPAGSFRDPAGLALSMLDRDGRPLGHRGAGPAGDIALSALPGYLPAAFVAFEDRRFRSHIGIDPIGIVRAAAANVAALSWRQGASTITQQLVKNLYLTPEKTLGRKLQEALIAIWLESHLSKDAILERYLNTVYLGAGAHGVDAAARRYFGKPASAVTLAEAAMLAGLAQAPSRTAPTVAPDLARQRAALVLDAMVETGLATAADAEAAKAAPAALAVPAVPAAMSGYALDWAAAEIRAGLGDVTGALAVRTTIDPGLQTLAATQVRRFLAAEGAAVDATQAALVAMRPDGAVVALVGGADHAASQFNRAVQARRQPGSLFKLFVYLAALQAGIGANDPVSDTPVTVDGWSPDNYSGRFHGDVTIRDAFAHSYNAAAVRLQERIGRDRVIRLARSMGIEGPLAPNPSLALGTSEVSLLEITAAFAAVRSNTARVYPRIVDAVVTAAGRSLAWPGERPAAAPWPRAAILDLLRHTVSDGTGRAARLAVPAYGKTGTTQDNRDAWFVGFAGDLVVGVWVGNDDGAPMKGVTGGGLPARLWHAYMVAALNGAALNGAPPSRQAPSAETPLPGRPVTEPMPDAADAVEGAVAVIDTGTLRVGGLRVRLLGVDGTDGPAARDMRDYIGDRTVQCKPAPGGRFRCEVDGWDLSEVVLFNGGGRATPDAPADYVRAADKARAQRRGIWAAGG